jgi:hypothetical protein
VSQEPPDPLREPEELIVDRCALAWIVAALGWVTVVLLLVLWLALGADS